ncbi:MAG: site-specific integrase [Candidatus Binatia bacterium]
MSVQTTAAGSYEVRYRVPHPLEPGKYIQKQKTFIKHRDAVDYDKKVHTQIKDGDYVPRSPLTVKEISEKWLEARKSRWKIQTYLSAKGHVGNYIVPELGHVKATALQFVAIEQAGAEWGKKLGVDTVNKIFADINRVYKFARKLGVRVNPMADVERLVQRVSPEQLEALALGHEIDCKSIPDHGEDHPAEKSNRLRAIRADEVYSALELKKIIEAGEPGLERVKHMLAILTGMRHGELNALRWSVVSLKRGTLFVNRSLTQLKGGAILEPPKTKNAYRTLKLAPELLSEIRKWKLACPKSPNDFVLCDVEGRPMNRKSNNDALKACCERAGVKVLSMNNLRHSFASQHLITRTPVLEVSRMMGHSDPAVTLKVYSRWADREESTSEIALAGRIFAAEDKHEATGSE